MREQVEKLRGELRSCVATLDPASVSLPEVPSLWCAFEALERLASAGKTLLAARVEESEVWRREGYLSAAEWLAAREGSSAGVARTSLDTGKRLGKLPTTEVALRAGKLSARQAAVVADGAAANPGAEDKLLGVAAKGSLAELREEALRAKAAADPDPDATRRRIRKNRGLRWYVGADGSWRFHGGGPNDGGAVVVSALEPIIQDLFAAARTRGEHEPRQAYAFDALVELARRLGCDVPAPSGREEPDQNSEAPPVDDGQEPTSGADKPRPAPRARYLALLRVDWQALLRGGVEEEEVCEIGGLGPVPVSLARELLGESVLKIVLTKGVDVANVTHLGQGASAAQKIALLWSQPGCSVAGCDRRIVQNDHRIPFADTRHRLDELDPLCIQHHRLKTIEGWELVAGKGNRAFVHPDHPRHPRHPRHARGSPEDRASPHEGNPSPEGRSPPERQSA